MKTFRKICRMEQLVLKSWLYKLLKAKYNSVVIGDGFLYAKGTGNAPVLLTAHMDTVHKEQCREITTKKVSGKTMVTSPQGIGGDDRCGIWMIWMILCKTKYRPSILFCEDEEIGGVGSNKFAETEYVDELKDLKYLIELDRANETDAVYYDCGNDEFMDYIFDNTRYKEAYGSFSDICHLSPVCDKASVNLSCGYYKAHTLEEFVIYEQMYNTYKTVKKLLSIAKEAPDFAYEEVKSWSYGDSYDYGNSYNYDYLNYVFREKNKYNYSYKDDEETCEYDDYSQSWRYRTYEIQYINETATQTGYFATEARSYDEAVGKFLIENSNLTYGHIIDYFVYDNC